MSGVGFAANTAAIATGTSAKTLLQIVAASNHRVKIDEIQVAFEGVSNTATPIKVDVLKQTDAGTMSALTLVKRNDVDDETLEVSAQHTATVEPSAGDVLMSFYVHPQTSYTWQAQYGREIQVPGGDRLGVRVTADADVNAIVRVFGEE